MKKWFIRRVALLAAATLIVSGFTACKTMPKTSSQTQSTSSSTDMATKYGKHWNESHDFDGRVFTIASTSKWNEPQATNKYTEAYVDRIQYYEDKWNCTIKWTVPSSDSTQYYSLINSSVLSGKPLADIVSLNCWQLFPAYVKGGIVQDLDKLGVFNWKDSKWNSTQMQSMCSYEGDKYGLYPVGSNQCYDIGWGIFFNKTMQETYNLPDLYTLARNGQWTWDKMLEIAKQATKDTNGDGKTDIYGYTGWMDALPYVYASGGYLVNPYTDKFEADSDKSVSAMEWYFNNMATCGSSKTASDKYPWVLPQKGTTDWDFCMKGFANQKVFMCATAFWCAGTYFMNMDDDWGWVPFPKANASSKYISYRESSTCDSILTGVQNPKDVALLYDAITDVKIGDDIYSEYLGDQFKDDESLEMLKLMLKSGGVEYSNIDNFDGLMNYFWHSWDKVREGTYTPRSAMDSIKDAVQTKIDTTLSKDYKTNTSSK